MVQVEDAETFRDVGRGWLKLRDSAAKEEEEHARFDEVLAATDLPQLLNDARADTPTDMQLGGLFISEWLPHVQQLECGGHGDQALELGLVLVEIAEASARRDGWAPAPAYTERVAIMYRKRRQRAEEVDVLERWVAACGPEGPGAGAAQQKLVARLVRAKELAAKEDGSRSRGPGQNTPR